MENPAGQYSKFLDNLPFFEETLAGSVSRIFF